MLPPINALISKVLIDGSEASYDKECPAVIILFSHVQRQNPNAAKVPQAISTNTPAGRGPLLSLAHEGHNGTHCGGNW